MAGDTNCLFMKGRMVKLAETKYPREGMAVVDFTIAVNESVKKNDSWEKRPNYFDCSWIGNYAKTIAPSMTKGREVFVTGKLHQDRWEKNGQKQSKIVIKCENVDLGRLPEGNKDNVSSGVPASDSYTAEDYESSSDEPPDQIPF